MVEVYQEQVRIQASADGDTTIYSQKVPTGVTIEVFMLSASGNNGLAGEYTQIGVNNGNVNNPFDSKVCDNVLETCFNRGKFYMVAGERAYGRFEAANSGEDLVLILNGLLYANDEFQTHYKAKVAAIS